MKEREMKDINLEESKIKINEQWFSTDEIAEEIQKKIQSGDMKIAEYASALEKLTVAIESSHVLEVKIAITKDEYSKLKALGKGDDKECIRKAIRTFIGKKKQIEKQNLEEKYSAPKIAASSKADQSRTIVKCIKCKSSIEIPTGTAPEDIHCPGCLNSDSKDLSDSQVKFKDHFLG